MNNVTNFSNIVQVVNNGNQNEVSKKGYNKGTHLFVKKSHNICALVSPNSTYKSVIVKLSG